MRCQYLLEGYPTYVNRENPVEMNPKSGAEVPVLAHQKLLNMSFEEIGKMLGYLKEKV